MHPHARKAHADDAQLLGSRARQIDNAPADERSAVVDPDHHLRARSTRVTLTIVPNGNVRCAAVCFSEGLGTAE